MHLLWQTYSQPTACALYIHTCSESCSHWFTNTYISNCTKTPAITLKRQVSRSHLTHRYKDRPNLSTDHCHGEKGGWIKVKKQVHMRDEKSNRITAVFVCIVGWNPPGSPKPVPRLISITFHAKDEWREGRRSGMLLHPLDTRIVCRLRTGNTGRRE